MIVLRAFGARGASILLLVLAVLVLVPRALVPGPTNAAAEAAVRASWGREASAEWLPRVQSRSGESAREAATAMAEALRAARERQISDISIRKAIVGPPFAWRWAYIVRLKTPPATDYKYFRVNRGFAAPVRSAWWTVPLF